MFFSVRWLVIVKLCCSTMKIFVTAIVSLGLFGITAQAQTGWNWDAQSYYGNEPTASDHYQKGSQIPVYNVDPSVCYEPGWDFGGYFSAMFPVNTTGADDGIGGGVSLSYFFDRNIGIETNYSIHGQGSAQQVVHTNVIYRLPIDACFCGAWAPYVFGGGGFLADGHFDLLADVGAGLEIRFQSWGCAALFTDYSYNFVEKSLDFHQVRTGFRLPF